MQNDNKIIFAWQGIHRQLESHRDGSTGLGAGADRKRRGSYWGDGRSQGKAVCLRRATSGGLGMGKGGAISELLIAADLMPGERRVSAGKDETDALLISAA